MLPIVVLFHRGLVDEVTFLLLVQLLILVRSLSLTFLVVKK
jgi:hypothetical protein